MNQRNSNPIRHSHIESKNRKEREFAPSLPSYSSNSFAILGVSNDLTRLEIFDIFRPFGEISFLQVSSMTPYWVDDHSLSLGEAYITFSHLYVPRSLLTSKQICGGVQPRNSVMQVVPKATYLAHVKNFIFVKKLPKWCSLDQIYHFF